MPPTCDLLNYYKVQAIIDKASQEAQRPKNAISLIAVSKHFNQQAILPLLKAGHRAFGENKVQEAAAKWPALRTQFPDLRLHLIGALQSNKAAQAVQIFDVIHTLDRPKIAQALAKEMQRQGRYLPCFIEINCGREPQKAGINPEELGEFLHYCRIKCGLNIIGLMTIPPAHHNPGPYFALCQSLGKKYGLEHLSMGMSNDFPEAITFGASFVRVGSAIFGPRSPGHQN